MRKYLTSLIVAGAMIVPGAVMAAGNIDAVTFEDPATGVTQPNVKCDRNETVQAHMTVTLTGTTDLESISYDNHDGLSRHRFDVVEDQINPGTWTVDFDYVCPSHGGTQSPTFWSHGVAGDTQTDNFATNSTSFDSMVATSAVTVSNVVSTTNPSVPTSTPTPTPTTTPVAGVDYAAIIANLTANITALQKQLQELISGGSLSKPPVCAGLSALVAGSIGGYSPANINLQNHLVKYGYMTQTQMNTGPGWYGRYTTAAVISAQAACNHS